MLDLFGVLDLGDFSTIGHIVEIFVAVVPPQF
jgi:hypothetical protein